MMKKYKLQWCLILLVITTCLMSCGLSINNLSGVNAPSKSPVKKEPAIQPSNASWMAGSWGITHRVDGGYKLDASAKSSNWQAGAKQIAAKIPSADYVITSFTHPAHAYLFTLRTNNNVDVSSIHKDMVPTLQNEKIILDVINIYRKAGKKVILYLNAQIKAGAQSVMVFDTWGGVLSGRDYKLFSLQYMEKIVSGLIRENEGRRVPVTLFTKNGGTWLESIAATGCDAIGLDWTVDIADARKRVGHKVALQGNMDPSMLYAPAPRIEEEVETILSAYGEGTGHVFNLGHGIHQHVNPDHLKVVVDSVHEFGRKG